MPHRPLLAAALIAAGAPLAASQYRAQVLEEGHAAFGAALETARFDAGGGETEWLFVGAPSWVDVNTIQTIGAVFAHERATPTAAWVERRVLVGASPQDEAQLGSALVFGDATLFAGSPGRDISFANQGSVTVFEHDGTDWSAVQELTASDPYFQRKFGSRLAFDAGTLFVAQPASEHESTGAVYVFERVGSLWLETARITPTDHAPYRAFASTGAIGASGGRLAVGAPGVLHGGLGDSVGVAYLFARGPAGWVQRARITPPTADVRQYFGDSVLLSGDDLYVGARGDEAAGEPWAFHLYDASASTVQLVRTVPDPWPGGREGRVAAISADTLLVTENERVEPTGGFWFEKGSVHVYRPADASQPPVARLVDGHFGLMINNRFGVSVDVLGTSLMVGASTHGDNDGSGRTYTLDHPHFAQSLCHCESQTPCSNAAHRMGCGNRMENLGWSGFHAAAFLGVGGSPSVSNDDLRFDAGGVLIGQTALLFAGTLEQPGGPAVLGNGLRCAGGSLRRLATASSSYDHHVTFGAGHGAAGGWQSGDARVFQVWYRDSNGPCGEGSNLTNAVRVVFEP